MFLFGGEGWGINFDRSACVCLSPSLSKMPSKESWSGQKTNRSAVHNSKQESRQSDLLMAALGMRLGFQKSSATIWQPLKLFAYSQLTSLVRRATLKENEHIPKYEKVHSFKVRRSSAFVRSIIARCLTFVLRHPSCYLRGGEGIQRASFE